MIRDFLNGGSRCVSLFMMLLHIITVRAFTRLNRLERYYLIHSRLYFIIVHRCLKPHSSCLMRL